MMLSIVHIGIYVHTAQPISVERIKITSIERGYNNTYDLRRQIDNKVFIYKEIP